MSSDTEQVQLINRREAIRRVSVLLGGAALVGGSGLLAALEKVGQPSVAAFGKFSAADIAFLDEIAETILPETKTPGAKAAKTGLFMALMVTDCYWPGDQEIFREGMRKVDEATRKADGVSFMDATPSQRLAILTLLDHEQKRVMDAREAAIRRKRGLSPLPVDVDAANPPGTIVDTRTITADTPAHYFRMMKELTLLGYYTSEIGCTKAMRYIETPSRYDACVPYAPGEPTWAGHA